MMIINGIWQWTLHEVAFLVHCFQVKLGSRMLVFVEGRKQENSEKNPQSRNKNQKLTQSTCDTRSRN